MADDFERIGPEVERQITEAARRAAGDTVGQDPQLNEELARIPFLPELGSDYKRDMTVIYQGQRMPVHDFNNFPIKLVAINDFLNHEKPKDTYAEALISAAEEMRYQPIFSVFRHQFPAVYKKVLEIQSERQARKAEQGPPGYDLRDEETYIVSQGYGAAAMLARELDQNYNLSFLR